MTPRRSRVISWAALALGIALLATTLWFLDLASMRVELASLGAAMPLVLLVSGIWHLARTIAWVACFPEPRRVGFWRLARVRLAAEAFSYLTLRGIAGEPLKVILLDPEVDPREATAAVALERLAFIVLTTAIVGVGAVYTILTLPLSRLWFRIFRAFAVASALIVGIAVAVLVSRRTYLARLLGGRRNGVARFMVAVERQLLDVARHNPRRLLILFAMNVVCYLAMAVEVFVVLRAVGAPATFGGALAVETFSRVAGFASAFIPANLGALEASSVAAVAAIGATSGGAALALARRIRGIFWAAAGLLVYPRRQRGAHAADGPILMYTVPSEASDASVFARVAGLPIAERVFRAAGKQGYSAVQLAAPGREEALARLAQRAGLSVKGGQSHLPGSQEVSVTVPLSPVPLSAVPLSSGFIPRPGTNSFEMLATRVLHDADVPAAEREIREAVFKPTDHNLARFNRLMSLPLSIALMRTPVTANQFSVGLLFLGLYAAWLFSQGTYLTGVAAAAVSLAASILDGCDGEIARLKHQESAFGCWLETVTDYTYYVAMFAGMTIGVARSTGWTGFYWVGTLSLAGLLASFLLLLYLRRRMVGDAPERFSDTLQSRFKQGGSSWSEWLTRLGHTATRAQMPYGILALALVNALPVVLLLCLVGANLFWMVLVMRLRALTASSREGLRYTSPTAGRPA